MTVRVGAKGQLVTPEAVREQAQLHPGDGVDVAFADEQLVISPRRRPASPGDELLELDAPPCRLEDLRSAPRERRG